MEDREQRGRPLRPFLPDLLLADLLILPAGTLLLGIPAATVLVIVAFFDLFCLFIAKTAPILPGISPVKQFLSMPDASAEAGFNRLMLANRACLVLALIVILTGFAVEMPSFPQSFSSLCVVLHVILGMVLILIALAYVSIRLVRAGGLRRILDEVVDFAAGISLFVLVLLLTELIRLDLDYLALTVAIWLGLAIWTGRSKRFPTTRAWIANWTNHLASAPFALIVLFSLCYVPFQLHIFNPYVRRWHVGLSELFVVFFLVSHVSFLLRGEHGMGVRARFKAVLKWLGRLGLMLILSLGILLATFFASQAPSFSGKAVQDLLLPSVPAGSASP